MFNNGKVLGSRYARSIHEYLPSLFHTQFSIVSSLWFALLWPTVTLPPLVWA